jgi:hypothetical protein
VGNGLKFKYVPFEGMLWGLIPKFFDSLLTSILHGLVRWEGEHRVPPYKERVLLQAAIIEKGSI